MSSARTQTGGALGVVDQVTTARDALELTLQGAIAHDVEADAVGAASALAQATQALTVTRAVSQHLMAVLAPTG